MDTSSDHGIGTPGAIHLEQLSTPRYLDQSKSSQVSPVMGDTIMAIPSNHEDYPSCQIRLMGMPPPGLMDPSHSQGTGFASSKEALELNNLAFPKLLSAETHSAKEIDILDATKEDPFTLESFEGLIKTSMKLGKDFIIARVVTMDGGDMPVNGNDEDAVPLSQRKLFFSYYAAHTINRVLFRTQPEEGLLHRMKAKNPMNNLLVVGDVHYYVIRAKDPSSNPLYTPISENTIAMESIVSVNEDEEKEKEKANGEQQDVIASPTSAVNSLNLQEAPQAPRPVIYKSTSTVTADEPLVYNAYYYATDDDYLMRRSVREYFKENASHPEEIFLFTLYGGSQQVIGDRTTFTQPLVSDPTNPHAVARTMEQAVAAYMRGQSSGDPMLVDQSSPTNNATPTSFWARLRNQFLEAPVPIEANATGQTNNNAGWLNSMRQYFHRSSDRGPRTQSSDTRWGHNRSESQVELLNTNVDGAHVVDVPTSGSPGSMNQEPLTCDARFWKWVGSWPILWLMVGCFFLAAMFQLGFTGAEWRLFPVLGLMCLAFLLFALYLFAIRRGPGQDAARDASRSRSSLWY